MLGGGAAGTCAVWGVESVRRVVVWTAARWGAAVEPPHAASMAVALYTLHNVFNAGSAYASGWLSDYIPQRKYVLAAGYALAAITLLLEGGGGLHWIPLGFLLAICIAASNAWILLVEVLR